MSKRQEQIMGDISELLKRQSELFAALPRSIRIGQIWSDAFKDGLNCTPILIGVNGSRLMNPKYPAPYQKVSTITRTFLRRKDGVEHDITEDEFFSIINASP